MTSRTFSKELLVMEDLAQGVGTVAQARFGQNIIGHKVDVPFAVVSQAEMLALDTSKYTRARVYSGPTEYTDYVYDSVALVWVKVLNDTSYTKDEINVMLADLALQPVVTPPDPGSGGEVQFGLEPWAGDIIIHHDNVMEDGRPLLPADGSNVDLSVYPQLTMLPAGRSSESGTRNYPGATSGYNMPDGDIFGYKVLTGADNGLHYTADIRTTDPASLPSIGSADELHRCVITSDRMLVAAKSSGYLISARHCLLSSPGTWNTVAGLAVEARAFCRNEAGTVVYAIDGSDLFISTDSGASFSVAATHGVSGTYDSWLACSADGSIVYIGGYQKVMKWTQAGGVVDITPAHVASNRYAYNIVCSNDGQKVFVLSAGEADDAHVLRSTDGGTTWSDIYIAGDGKTFTRLWCDADGVNLTLTVAHEANARTSINGGDAWVTGANGVVYHGVFGRYGAKILVDGTNDTQVWSYQASLAGTGQLPNYTATGIDYKVVAASPGTDTVDPEPPTPEDPEPPAAEIPAQGNMRVILSMGEVPGTQHIGDGDDNQLVENTGQLRLMGDMLNHNGVPLPLEVRTSGLTIRKNYDYLEDQTLGYSLENTNVLTNAVINTSYSKPVSFYFSGAAINPARVYQIWFKGVSMGNRAGTRITFRALDGAIVEKEFDASTRMENNVIEEGGSVEFTMLGSQILYGDFYMHAQDYTMDAGFVSVIEINDNPRVTLDPVPGPDPT